MENYITCPNFFEETLKEALKLDLKDIKEPECEIEFDETELGVITSEFTKQLYELIRVHMKEIADYFANHSMEAVKNNSEWRSHALKLSERIKLLRRICWFEIRQELDIWNVPALNVVKGWKIVSYGDGGPGINYSGIIFGEGPFSTI